MIQAYYLISITPPNLPKAAGPYFTRADLFAAQEYALARLSDKSTTLFTARISLESATPHLVFEHIDPFRDPDAA
jgi:hypothetical protein